MTRSTYLFLGLIALMAISGCGKKEKAAEDVASVNRKLQEADALVQKWADKLQPEAKGKFVQHEGLTEQDPWNHYVRLTYDHGVFTENLDIRSAGPDQVFDTADDLVRKREHKSATAYFGEKRSTGTEAGTVADAGWSWPFIVGVWLVLGIFALFIAEVRRGRANRSLARRDDEAQPDGSLRRTNRRRRGIVGAGFIVMFGGISLFTTMLAAMCGALFDCDPCDCGQRRNGRRGPGALDLLGGCGCDDCDAPDFDCGGCDGCDMPDCGGCDAPDCGGCGGCDAPDCSGCDCSGCDCGGCDCGGCDCGGCDC